MYNVYLTYLFILHVILHVEFSVPIVQKDCVRRGNAETGLKGKGKSLHRIRRRLSRKTLARTQTADQGSTLVT